MIHSSKFRHPTAPRSTGAVYNCTMSTPHREVVVAPDHFEIVADDALLIAELQSAIAVCIYDAIEEAGALLHLRFIVRSPRPADLTDTTLATELLLLDRCIESLREDDAGRDATCRPRSPRICPMMPRRRKAALQCSRSSGTIWTTRE